MKLNKIFTIPCSFRHNAKQVAASALAGVAALCMAGLLASCSDDEESLTPSGISSAYQLPQGNHDYDNDIVDFYNSTGTYILYKFSQKEARWSPTSYEAEGRASVDSTGAEGYELQPADEDYVGPLLDILHKYWLDNYSSEFKKQLLPSKILLCSQLDSVYQDWDINWDTWEMKEYYPGVAVPGWYNYHNICVNYANENVATLTDADKKHIGSYLDAVLMNAVMAEGKVAPTSEFASVVDYTTVQTEYDPGVLFSKGTFYGMGNLYYTGSNSLPSAERDWYYFMVMMVSYPERFLYDEAAGSASGAWFASEADQFWGCLSAVRDTNGLLKQRYSMVRQYFITNYNMDLQAIGNSKK